MGSQRAQMPVYQESHELDGYSLPEEVAVTREPGPDGQPLATAPFLVWKEQEDGRMHLFGVIPAPADREEVERVAHTSHAATGTT